MKTWTTLYLVLLFSACNTDTKSNYFAMAESTDYQEIGIIQENQGKKLMENNCYVCHNPKASMEKMIAPPLIAVKMYYISENTSKEEFTNAVVEWMKNPSAENSKIPGAVKKFGLMPYQFYPEATIRKIAEYMFDNEIEEPEWFQEHFNKMHGEKPKTKGRSNEK